MSRQPREEETAAGYRNDLSMPGDASDVEDISQESLRPRTVNCR